jgi:hypothetical protein
MIKVIDNFLDPGYYNELEGLIESHTFQWGFMSDEEKCGIFSHGITNNGNIDSSHYNFLSPLLYSIASECQSPALSRARLDMTMLNPNSDTHEPHVDMFEKHIAVIFYIGDFDGGTEIYNETYSNQNWDVPDHPTLLKSVDAKPNRLLIFSGNQYHCGIANTKSRRRILLNANYTIMDNNEYDYNI